MCAYLLLTSGLLGFLSGNFMALTELALNDYDALSSTRKPGYYSIPIITAVVVLANVFNTQTTTSSVAVHLDYHPVRA